MAAVAVLWLVPSVAGYPDVNDQRTISLFDAARTTDWVSAFDLDGSIACILLLVGTAVVILVRAFPVRAAMAALIAGMALFMTLGLERFAVTSAALGLVFLPPAAAALIAAIQSRTWHGRSRRAVINAT